MNVVSMSVDTLAAAGSDAVSLSGGFVVAMGMGIVFVGLVCIVVLCSIMSKVVKILEKLTDVPAPAAPVPTPVPAPAVPVQEPIANRQELVAAISAALAEELGKDVSAIRILSLKKV